MSYTIPQAVKNLLRVSRILYKGATVTTTKYNMTIKNNGASENLNAIKGQNSSTKRFSPDVCQTKRQTEICQENTRFKITQMKKKSGVTS